MKERFIFDMGRILDEIFNTAHDFKHTFKDKFKCDPEGWMRHFHWDENVDYYPLYGYPPVNVYLTKERELILEFALAGFEENDINLQFQGDYMVLSAKPSPDYNLQEDVRYFKRRLKFKEIMEQKYYVPENKFDREKVKAVFKSGILRVTIPPKEGYTPEDGIKIDIVKEGE